MAIRILLLVAPAAPKDCGIDALQICALHVLQDQANIITSPSRIKPEDLLWLAPFAAGTGYTLAQDASIMQDLGHDPGREKDFKTASNILGIYASAGYALGRFITASIKHDDHLRETSLLVTEAGVNAPPSLLLPLDSSALRSSPAKKVAASQHSRPHATSRLALGCPVFR
jgi:hypothetical protein